MSAGPPLVSVDQLGSLMSEALTGSAGLSDAPHIFLSSME